MAGRKAKEPPFASVINDTFQALDLPNSAVNRDLFSALYSQLCAYAHKPLLEEAVITLKGGNAKDVTATEVRYWLGLVESVQRSLLDIAIGSSPQALFPVDVYRKFGFNGPVGALFDNSNGISIEQALGKTRLEAYRQHFAGNDPPASQLAWFDQHPDLTDEAILQSFTDTEALREDDSKKPIEQRVLLRSAIVKAKMRTLLWAFSYGKDTPWIASSDRDRIMVMSRLRPK